MAEETRLDTKTDVWGAVWKLKADRRDFQRKVMANFDKRYYAVLKAIQTRCGELGDGHEWHWTHPDVTGEGHWETCAVCGETRHLID